MSLEQQNQEYAHELRGRVKRLRRFYSQFVIEPWGTADDAAWRLGGIGPPSQSIRLFQDAIGTPRRNSNGQEFGTAAITNLHRPEELPNATDINRWFLRLSREVDDLLRWFLGTCSIWFTSNGIVAQEAVLLSLLGDGEPLVAPGETRLHIRDNMRIEVVIEQRDSQAFAEYSAHLRKQDPPRLAGWVYLEGIEYLRIT